MSDEEYDYMSDNFLTECVKDDIRPGLIKDRKVQRLNEIQKKKEEKDLLNKLHFRPSHVVEAEKRQEGLQSVIDTNNRGFAMLQKMGYKPGSGIGKTGEGRVEPIPITVKSDRQGLGRETILKRIAVEKAAMREQLAKSREMMMNIDNYRAQMTQKVTERYIDSDFKKSQRICYQLDLNAGYDEPAESWFWPQRDNLNAYDGSRDDEDEGEAEYPDKYDSDDDDEEEEEEEEDEEDKEEGDDEVKYPQTCDNDRTFGDDKEYTDNVDANKHHTKSEETVKGTESSSRDDCDDSVYEEECEFEPSQKLEIITTYLRETYWYCIWCGVQYDDEKDMRDNCPGPTRNDH